MAALTRLMVSPICRKAEAADASLFLFKVGIVDTLPTAAPFIIGTRSV